MRIKSWVLGLVVMVFIFGGIGISTVTGGWQTTSTKVPAKYSTGEFAGQYNPADIRGSYTFGEISEVFDLPLNDLASAFDIQINKAREFQVKELESLYFNAVQAVGTNSVRTFVALYKGLPITLSTSDYFLPAAVQILKEEAALTDEQKVYLDSHIFQSQPAASTSTTGVSSPSSTPTHTTTAGTIIGKTTFQDLLDWGLKQEGIEAVINEKLPAKTLAVRDYASQKGIEFTTLKSQLQALLEALQK
jgi:hypothetical protein